MIGKSLEHYEIVELLGAGGMGEVYRAHDTKLKRDVAIKLLPQDFAGDRERLARFEREAQLLASLNHPNIAAIHGLEECDGVGFLVLELVEGETLAERLATGRFEVEETLEICRQIAEALEAAHGRGIVHRDLKPANVKVTAEGKVKVLDFGLAKAYEIEGLAEGAAGEIAPDLTQSPTVAAATRTGIVLGTATYMSPEQARGKPLDKRTDIWSFGCVLYEMLAARRAFQGETASDTMAAVLKEEPDWSALPEETPAKILDLLRRCLHKNSRNRLQDLGDARVEIEEAAHLDALARIDLPPDFVAAVMAKVAQYPAYRRRGLIATVGAVGTVAALLAILVGFNVGGLRDRLTGTGSEVGPRSVESLAVLPFDNLSGDPEKEYFADGMTDALIAELGQIAALQVVISRNSVMKYKEEQRPLPEIARDLGVEGLVEASVLYAGDRVRITAQLFHGPTETPLWSNSYEGDAGDTLTLLREVSRAIAREIRLALTPEDEARLATVRPVNREAQEAYLRGLSHWNKRTGEDVERSIDYFRRAIGIDPDYALAYAGLADAYVLAPFFVILPPREAAPEARAAALMALRTDESLAEAHAALAYTLTLFDRQWDRSEEEFQRALALNSNYATAHFHYAAHLAARGQIDEAIREAERAWELDPIEPIIAAGVAWMFHLAGDDPRTIEQSMRVLDLDPNFAIGHARLGIAYEHEGRYEEAIAELQTAIAGSGQDPVWIAALGHAYAVSGRESEARRIIDQLTALSQHRYVSAYSIATVYAGLGDKDPAFEWLLEAYDERSWNLAFLRVDPDMDPLHSDPRFQDLVQRMNFPE